MGADIWWWERRGQWCANVRDPRSQRRLRWYLGAEETEARREFHLRMAALLGGEADTARRPSGRMTLAELATLWLEWNEVNRAQATVKFRQTYLAWIVVRAGFTPAGEIRPADVERIKRERRRQNAPRSINHFVRAIKGLYNWAVDQGLLAENPVARVKGVPRAPVERKALSMLAAVRACRAADASPPLGDFMRLLLHTGLRSGELAGLTWSAYDRGAAVLTVSGHKTVGRSGQPRMVPLSVRAVRVLEALPCEGDSVFGDGEGRALSRSALWQRWRRVRAHREELRRVTFHAFRHTFVSRLLARGVPEWEVQRLVGHSSTLMTRYYATADMRRLREAVERL